MLLTSAPIYYAPSAGMGGGMGLFDSGLNPAGWGLMEWLIVGGGAFLLLGGGKMLGSSRKRRNPARRTRARRRRNVQMGYYDGTGFHPIRRSKDYDPDRAGDEY